VDTYGVGIEIANTSKSLIDKVAAIVPGGTFTSQGPEQNDRRKQTIYRWRLAPNEVKRLAQELYPHLVAKQHQARLVFSCPSNGEGGAAAHQAMMDLHNGVATTVDYPAPPSLFEPGWFVRSDVIWAKPNPMPESCRDRPTSAHEHVFLITKSSRYYYDADAVREDASENTHAGYSSNGAKTQANADAFGVKPSRFDGYRPPNRNLRNVWTIATAPYSEAHFATFPPALAERCIKAGTSERGCCGQCGKPWVRVTDVERRDTRPALTSKYGGLETDIRATGPGNVAFGLARRTEATVATTGWRAGCECRSLRCISCGLVLDTQDAKRVPSTTAHMRALRQELPSAQAADQILQPGVPGRISEDTAGSDVPSVQGCVSSPHEPNQAMQLGMFQKMDRAQPFDREGLDDHQQGLQAASETRPSERDRGWLHDGASAGDGEEAGKASDIGRGGASQERRQAGQSDQQSGTDGKAAARRASKAGLSCDVPALSDGVSDARPCPHCGSDTEWTTPATSPCVVLDCFAGAGTTLLVADRLQRDSIGIELNTTYTEMAMQRCWDDAPLLHEIGPVPEHPVETEIADLFAEASE
jgi:hypothetical protein